jgi:hypothetical protein
MASYITTKILNYSSVLNDDNRITVDYSSINIPLINEYIDSCDYTYFGYMPISENTTLQKISLDLYGSVSYWDLLIILNKYDPLFDTVFEFDTIMSLSEDKTEELNSELFNGLLPVNIKSAIQDNYYKKYSEKNAENRVLKYVLPEKMSEFLRNGNAQGYLA